MLAFRNENFGNFFKELENTVSVDRQPAVNAFDDDDKYVIVASLPGIDKESLDIEVADNTLIFSAKTKQQNSKDENRYHLNEIFEGKYSRSIKFALKVNASKVEARYAEGILEISLPKEESVKPRKIKLV